MEINSYYSVIQAIEESKTSVLQTEPRRRQGFGVQRKRVCKYSCERGQKRREEREKREWGRIGNRRIEYFVSC